MAATKTTAPKDRAVEADHEGLAKKILAASRKKGLAVKVTASYARIVREEDKRTIAYVRDLSDRRRAVMGLTGADESADGPSVRIDVQNGPKADEEHVRCSTVADAAKALKRSALLTS